MRFATVLLLLLGGCANQLIHDPFDRNLAQNKAAQEACQAEQLREHRPHAWTALCFNRADETYFTRVQFPWMDLVHDLENERLRAALDVDAGRTSLAQGQSASAAAQNKFAAAWRQRLAATQQRQDYDSTVALAILGRSMAPTAPPLPVQVQIVPQNLACGPLGCMPY